MFESSASFQQDDSTLGESIEITTTTVGKSGGERLKRFGKSLSNVPSPEYLSTRRSRSTPFRVSEVSPFETPTNLSSCSALSGSSAFVTAQQKLLLQQKLERDPNLLEGARLFREFAVQSWTDCPKVYSDRLPFNNYVRAYADWSVAECKRQYKEILKEQKWRTAKLKDVVEKTDKLLDDFSFLHFSAYGHESSYFSLKETVRLRNSLSKRIKRPDIFYNQLPRPPIEQTLFGALPSVGTSIGAAIKARIKRDDFIARHFRKSGPIFPTPPAVVIDLARDATAVERVLTEFRLRYPKLSVRLCLLFDAATSLSIINCATSLLSDVPDRSGVRQTRLMGIHLLEVEHHNAKRISSYLEELKEDPMCSDELAPLVINSLVAQMKWHLTLFPPICPIPVEAMRFVQNQVRCPAPPASAVTRRKEMSAISRGILATAADIWPGGNVQPSLLEWLGAKPRYAPVANDILQYVLALSSARWESRGLGERSSTTRRMPGSESSAIIFEKQEMSSGEDRESSPATNVMPTSRELTDSDVTAENEVEWDVCRRLGFGRMETLADVWEGRLTIGTNQRAIAPTSSLGKKDEERLDKGQSKHKSSRIKLTTTRRRQKRCSFIRGFPYSFVGRLNRFRKQQPNNVAGNTRGWKFRVLQRGGSKCYVVPNFKWNCLNTKIITNINSSSSQDIISIPWCHVRDYQQGMFGDPVGKGREYVNRHRVVLDELPPIQKHPWKSASARWEGASAIGGEGRGPLTRAGKKQELNDDVGSCYSQSSSSCSSISSNSRTSVDSLKIRDQIVANLQSDYANEDVWQPQSCLLMSPAGQAQMRRELHAHIGTRTHVYNPKMELQRLVNFVGSIEEEIYCSSSIQKFACNTENQRFLRVLNTLGVPQRFLQHLVSLQPIQSSLEDYILSLQRPTHPLVFPHPYSSDQVLRLGVGFSRHFRRPFPTTMPVVKAAITDRHTIRHKPQISFETPTGSGSGVFYRKPLLFSESVRLTRGPLVEMMALVRTWATWAADSSPDPTPFPFSVARASSSGIFSSDPDVLASQASSDVYSPPDLHNLRDSRRFHQEDLRSFSITGGCIEEDLRALGLSVTEPEPATTTERWVRLVETFSDKPFKVFENLVEIPAPLLYRAIKWAGHGGVDTDGPWDVVKSTSVVTLDKGDLANLLVQILRKRALKYWNQLWALCNNYSKKYLIYGRICEMNEDCTSVLKPKKIERCIDNLYSKMQRILHPLTFQATPFPVHDTDAIRKRLLCIQLWQRKQKPVKLYRCIIAGAWLLTETKLEAYSQVLTPISLMQKSAASHHDKHKEENLEKKMLETRQLEKHKDETGGQRTLLTTTQKCNVSHDIQMIETLINGLRQLEQEFPNLKQSLEHTDKDEAAKYEAMGVDFKKFNHLVRQPFAKTQFLQTDTPSNDSLFEQEVFQLGDLQAQLSIIFQKCASEGSAVIILGSAIMSREVYAALCLDHETAADPLVMAAPRITREMVVEGTPKVNLRRFPKGYVTLSPAALGLREANKNVERILNREKIKESCRQKQKDQYIADGQFMI